MQPIEVIRDFPNLLRTPMNSHKCTLVNAGPPCPHPPRHPPRRVLWHVPGPPGGRRCAVSHLAPSSPQPSHQLRQEQLARQLGRRNGAPGGVPRASLFVCTGIHTLLRRSIFQRSGFSLLLRATSLNALLGKSYSVELSIHIRVLSSDGKARF